MARLSEKLAQLVETQGLQATVTPGSPGADYWLDLSIPGGKAARIPMLGTAPEPLRLPWAIQAALNTLANYVVCDDFLDWCDELGYAPADSQALAHYRELDSACWALAGLLGYDDLEALSLEIQIGQAISAAAASFERNRES